MKRITVRSGATLVAMALALSACGSSDGSSTDTSGTLAGSLIMGGAPESRTRADGLPGLKKKYGVVFQKFVVTDTGGPITVNALKNGQIDVAALFTTDPSIAANDFVILDDTAGVFGAQNVLPVMNIEKATAGVRTTLNAVSAQLDTEGLGAMMGEVVLQKQDPLDVATTWLAEKGLDAPGTAADGVELTIGSANFPENVLLAQIYAEALSAQGADISLKLNIGARAKYLPALKDGTLDLMPEYSGSLLTALDPKTQATEPAAVLDELRHELPQNLTVLDASKAQDGGALVVTRKTADTHRLVTIADLAKRQ
jgi:glycine betaine/choline ABC-type transport system substrate-binding protein